MLCVRVSREFPRGLAGPLAAPRPRPDRGPAGGKTPGPSFAECNFLLDGEMTARRGRASTNTRLLAHVRTLYVTRCCDLFGPGGTARVGRVGAKGDTVVPNRGGGGTDEGPGGRKGSRVRVPLSRRRVMYLQLPRADARTHRVAPSTTFLHGLRPVTNPTAPSGPPRRPAKQSRTSSRVANASMAAPLAEPVRTPDYLQKLPRNEKKKS